MKIINDIFFLYKYTSIDRLFEMLENSQLTFLPKDKYWRKDRFEGYLFKNLYTFHKTYHNDSWSEFSYLKNVCYMCLSSDTETDQIWKTYTPEKTGVCLKLSVRKLDEKLGRMFYLSKIRYKKIEDIKKIIAVYKKKVNPTEEELIELYLYKMRGFKTDNEYRLLKIEREKESQELVRVPFDYNETIQKILFHPRCETVFFNVMKDVLNSRYKIPEERIKPSTLHNPIKRFGKEFT